MAKTILYVGRFKLPEGNAASSRVLAVSDILAAAGYRVCLVGLANSAKDAGRGSVLGHDYLALEERSRAQKFRGRFTSDWVERGISEFGLPAAVVYYNFSSAALIASCARRSGVAHIADCTEWYGGEASAAGLFRVLDSEVRMRLVHTRMSGVIAISGYLKRYYESHTRVLQLPPMVNLEDPKWQRGHPGLAERTDQLRLVYAGDPGASKDGLDEVVAAVDSLDPGVDVRLDVYGLTLQQANARGVAVGQVPGRVEFHGRVPHDEALRATAEADYVVFARRPTRANLAGFSTKLVETITLGTGVMTTRVGEARVLDSLDSTVWIEEVSVPAIQAALLEAQTKRSSVDHQLDDRFSIDRHRAEVEHFFTSCLGGGGSRPA